MLKLSCAWCLPRPSDEAPDTSHGICDEHYQEMLIAAKQRQFDKVPSYVSEREAFEQYKARKAKHHDIF